MNDTSDPASEAIDRLRSVLGTNVAVASMADRRIEVIATAYSPIGPASLDGFVPLDRREPHRMFGTWLEPSGSWLIVTIVDPDSRRAPGPPANADRALPGRGVVVGVLGPDGAGKTTALSALGVSYIRPIRFAKLRLRSIRAPGPIGWLWELGRILRLGLATRMARRRGEIVAWDRHPLEDRLPWPTRRVMDSRWRWLAPIIPDPDVIIVLDAPIEVLIARRPEEDEDVLKQVRERYRVWAQVNPQAHLVDATAPHAEVVRRMTAAVWAWEVAATRSGAAVNPETP